MIQTDSDKVDDFREEHLIVDPQLTKEDFVKRYSQIKNLPGSSEDYDFALREILNQSTHTSSKLMWIEKKSHLFTINKTSKGKVKLKKI